MSNILPDILRSLNSQQQRAVTHVDTPLLILAGPGSGKTTVITAKIAWLIYEVCYRPQEILAMTFTNKAAKEMLLRVQDIMRNANFPITGKPYISTFHSFGAYLLRRFSNEIGLPKDFQIYDIDDQVSLLKQIKPKEDSKKLRGFLTGVSRAKDHGLLESDTDSEFKNFINDVTTYRAYEELKRNTGNVDFGDLLTLPYKLLKYNEDVKKQVQRYWKWFLIDEYQDTNRIQFLLLQELCGHTNNVCVVGDDDQSIYKFRGAVVENILMFNKKIPNTTTIKLEQNYRSTSKILNFANDIIAANSSRHEKNIFSKLPDGEKPHLVTLQNEDEEQYFVIDIAQKALNLKESCALFFRTNAQSRMYEMALRSAGILYTLVGAISFFSRAEVKDILAYLRIFRNSHDVISFLRIANKPTRGIGDKSLQSIATCMKDGFSWQKACEVRADSLSSSAKKGCAKLLEIFSYFSDKNFSSIGDIANTLLQRSGLLALYTEEKTEENKDRMRNIEEFISYAHDFPHTDEGWTDFLEKISLAEDAPHTKGDGIQLMTLHRSKGLEFDTVVICGVEEGTIPMSYMMNFDDDALEEERRLLYVGITRAKKNLYLTTSNIRRRYGNVDFCNPSSFLYYAKDSLHVRNINGHSPNNVGIYKAENPPKKNEKTVHATTLTSEEWIVHEQVHHKDYGYGFVNVVRKQGVHTVIRVEFDSGFEGDFMPKFDSSIKRVTLEE